jgi:hypothetical protein
MLRNCRPDYVTLPDYNWRYVAAVRTEIAYTPQDPNIGEPSHHFYQNILRNGGTCGPRAFFGRFILRAFGVPTWGVTQRSHAALSHWTPRGWVINLGAAFQYSWWDKDGEPMSGTQFQLETRARADAADYAKVLRAQWLGRILGEPSYNERKSREGGFWNSTGHYLAMRIASTAAIHESSGPEANQSGGQEEKPSAEAPSITDRQTRVDNGVITIPAVAHGKTTGKSAAMKSHSDGMQLRGYGGFGTEYAFETIEAGRYELSIRVATTQDGQVFITSANQGNPPVETPVPYTKGMRQETPPVAVELAEGKNTLRFEIKKDSRCVAIKEFILRPVK